MNNGKKINICRPGFGASCALCCGSHNFGLSEKQINRIFKSRGKIKGMRLPAQLSPALYPEHKGMSSGEAMQCGNIGILKRGSPEIGCLIYDCRKNADMETAEFFENTCKKFLCAAAGILDEAEIIFAAKLARDWYHYGLLVNDIDFLRRIIRNYKNSGGISIPEKKAFLESIRQKAFQWCSI